MKRESAFRKLLVCTGYLFIAIFLILSLFVLIVKASSRENDNIVSASDSSTSFVNQNPKFNVSFVNSEYIRFETIKSYRNPFEEKKENIWEKIMYILGINSKKLGVTVTLENISHDQAVKEILKEKGIDILDEIVVEKKFELVESGREIGNTEGEAISKDTVVSRNIYKGIDVEYQIIPGKGLKEEIVLRELPEYSAECVQGECNIPANRYRFRLTVDDGLELRSSIAGLPGYPSGTKYIVDKEGNYFAHFLPEYAVDSVGNKTSDVYVEVLEGENLNEYIFEVTLDANWLMSGNRVFPIRIDPSIVHDSSLSFDLGMHDRTELDMSSVIKLSNALSGVYTSSILPLGDSVLLEDIKWGSFGNATGGGEIPFSNIGLLLEENFNSNVSEVNKWGGGLASLNGSSSSFKYDISSTESNYFSVDFWLYNRYIEGVVEENILSSNLGSLAITNGLYTIVDTEGIKHTSSKKVEYNQWKHITVVFDLNGSNISLYIDGQEEKIPISSTALRKISSVTLGSSGTSMFGYIDTLRVYDRLLTRYEILSNSQYTNIYLQYRNSTDGKTWSKWFNYSEYTPEYTVNDAYIEVNAKEGDSLGSYDILSFSFASDENSSMYIGKSKLLDGVVSLEQKEGNLDSNEPIGMIDFWFTPQSVDNICLLTLGDTYIYTSEDGRVVSNLTGTEIIASDSYKIGVENHYALYFDKGAPSISLNGNLSAFGATSDSLVVDSYVVGNGCPSGIKNSEKELRDLKVTYSSNTNFETVREIYELESKKYELKSTFKAKLQSNSNIKSLEQTTFSISEMEYGATDYAVNIKIGDIIVLEQIEAQKKYILEGEVISINKSTGLIEVSSWNGEIPSTGFTTESKVYRWQSEYITLKNYINISGPIESIYLRNDSMESIRVRDINMFTTIKEEDREVFLRSESNQYLQYRFILTSSRDTLSPYLSSVNISYSISGPTMEQIMRHGKWFLDGEEQPFWWAK